MEKQQSFCLFRARDEEPQKTTQESMFNYIRLSDGGKERHFGPRSEGHIISDIAARVLKESPIKWKEFQPNTNIRDLIGKIVPGFEKIGMIDQTKEEFHITGRILHSPEFPTTDGRATFAVCSMPQLSIKKKCGIHLQTYDCKIRRAIQYCCV